MTLPQRLEGLVSRMLAKSPQDRPQSFSAAGNELKRISQILSQRDQSGDSFSGEYTGLNSDTLAQNYARALEQAETGERSETKQATPKKKTALLRLSLTFLLACGLGAGLYFQHKALRSNEYERQNSRNKEKQEQKGAESSPLSHPIAEVTGVGTLPSEGELDKIPKIKYQLDGQKLPDKDPDEKDLNIKEGQFDKTADPNLPGRTFHFPSKMSIGQLLYWDRQKTIVIEAKGNVTTTDTPSYDPGLAVYKHPEILRGFAPNSLAVLRKTELCPITDEHIFYLARLTGLRELYMGSSQFSARSVPYLNKITALRTLHIGKSKIRGDELLGLETRRLNSLDVSAIMNVDQFLRKPFGFPNLRVLLAAFDNLTDDDMAVIGGFTNLNQLHIEGNHTVTNKSMPSILNLKQLVRLEIQGTGINPEAIPYLCRMNSLSDIVVDSGFWKDKDVARLKKEMGRPINVWLD